MSSSSDLPRIIVFAPDALLSVAIEAAGTADEVHLHAAGQGVWVARMAAELGARPILCTFIGGETGATLRPLLEAIPGEVRGTEMRGCSGSYVVDRRSGERRILGSALRPSPQRHETDDLVTSTTVAALAGDVLVICNPFPAEGFPTEAYETVMANVKAADIPVIVDMSSPRLDHVLGYGPDLVKLNDWELAEYVRGPVDGERVLLAAQRLRDAGARNVVVTRAERPILVVPENGEPFDVVPPAFPRGFREGCGDSMTGAIAAGWAGGMTLLEAIVLGAAAGAVNFLRHGLGTGKREAVKELARRVEVRSVDSEAAISR